jgi:amino acid adenylation domain-containing protein
MNSVNTESVKGFRLSPQQKRVWLQPHQSRAYRCQIGVLLEGKLEPDRFSQALQRVVDRYEILRTTFKSAAGLKTAVQVISDSVGLELRTIDFSGEPLPERSTLLEDIFRLESGLANGREQASPLQANLLVYSPRQHILLLGLPALCADAATMRNLVSVLADEYATAPGAQTRDEPPQYADLAEWQNELLEGPDTEAGRDFWRLKDYRAISSWRLPRLRRERAASVGQEFEPGIVPVDIATELAERVKALAAGEGVEEAAYYFGCWQVLLWRMTGELPLLCGVYCDGREDEDLSQVLGPLGKYVPVDCRLTTSLTIREAVGVAGEQLREARTWADYYGSDHLPLTDQANELSPLPSSSLDPQSSTPRVESLPYFALSFEETDEGRVIEKQGLRFTVLRHEAYTERFEIKLQLSRLEQQRRIELYYDPECFSAEEMKLLAERYALVLQTAAENSLQEVQAVNFVGFEERRQIEGWNETEISFGSVCTLAEMLAAQTEKTPAAVAVAFADSQLTYAELNGRANALGHYLKSRGVGPNVPVALFVERSLEMIIGLLGILKAGGAYVPLDPASPKPRLAYQLADVAAPLVITQERLLNKLPDCGAQVLCLDRDRALFANWPATNPEGLSDPQQLAYVIYTSGSTGAPKGVAVTHQSIFNYTKHVSERLAMMTVPGCAALQFATVSTLAADLGNTCVFTSLASGGCLHILSHEVATDGRQFAEYCSRHEIDVLKIVPSHLNALLSAEEHAALLPRRCLILGGEALSLALLARVRRLAPNCRVINHYGPTETTIGSLTFDVDANADSLWRTATVPIGRPIANTQVYILNELLNRVPVGIAGQLYIGGAGLAQGYLQQPELTAEQFIPDPFSSQRPGRLYRTGDQARYLQDGNIEFLGRVDHQVKIRGFRVELGEIETALRSHPDVHDAVVLVSAEPSTEQRLVAYVVGPEKETLPVSELRHFLQKSLPEHMVPAGIIFLKDLPLTPNGKIDRNALPAYDWTRPDQEGAFVGPGNKIEAALAEVWSQILGIERVGVQDNFFELGGDSIATIQIAARAGRIGLRFAPMEIFRSPTIAALASIVEATPDFSSHEAPVESRAPLTSPIAQLPEESPYALSPAQQGILFHCLYSPNSGMYTSQLNYTLSRDFDAPAFIRAWQRIVDRHSIFRTAFVWEGLDDPVQVASERVLLPLREFDWRALSRIEQQARLTGLVDEERLRDFNFSVPPLLRFLLIRFSDDEYQYVWTYHHLLMDGWSETIVLDELAALYRAFSRQQELELEPAPPYRNYIAWLQQQDLKGAETYWRRALKGFSAATIFKVDPPRNASSQAGASAGAQRLRIAADATRAITRAARESQLTLNILAQGVWAFLLSYFSGEDDVVFGATVSGRPSDLPGVERMVGMFINTLPVRVRLTPGKQLDDWLQELQQQQAEMLSYEFSPLVKVQTWSDIQPGMPLFETILVFQNTPGSSQTQPTPEPERRVVISNVEFNEGKTNFALSVDVEPGVELSLNISYDRQRFEPSFIKSLLESFEVLLRAFAARPQTKLEALRELLDAALRQRQIEQQQELEETSLQKLQRIPRRAARAAFARENN